MKTNGTFARTGEHYSSAFYKTRHQQTIYSAKTILSLVMPKLPSTQSVVDVGCGVGTWLTASQELGAKTIQGLDGVWVDKELLAIPKEFFQTADLTKRVMFPGKFDLAISLEVAEHLPLESAKDFVLSLINLSDFVLFSAAIPFQGGTNHLNEQWPDYWQTIFADNGYVVLDFIRKEIWNDQQIPIYYRQNVLFYARKERIKDLINFNQDGCSHLPTLSVVHPDAYIARNEEIRSVRGSWKYFFQSLKNWPNRKFTKQKP